MLFEKVKSITGNITMFSFLTSGIVLTKKYVMNVYSYICFISISLS